MSDPWNNIYVDGDNIVQVRYRIRVVKDYRPGWGGFIPTTGAVDNVLGYTTETPDGSVNYITPQGKLEFAPYYLQVVNGQKVGAIITSYMFSYTNGGTVVPYDKGGFTHDWSHIPSVISYKGEFYFAIAIALVARRNIGAFHPQYNPNGSSKFADGKMWWEVSIPEPPKFDVIGVNIKDTDGDGTNDLFQFIVSGDQTANIKSNYFVTVTGSSKNDGRYWVTKVDYDSDNNQTVITVANTISDSTADGQLYSDFGYVKYCFDNRDANSGLISTGVSGRPDGKYADEINEGDVKDLRNYALRVTDYSRILDKWFNKLVKGDVRGWENETGSYVEVFNEPSGVEVNLYKYGNYDYGGWQFASDNDVELIKRKWKDLNTNIKEFNVYYGARFLTGSYEGIYTGTALVLIENDAGEKRWCLCYPRYSNIFVFVDPSMQNSVFDYPAGYTHGNVYTFKFYRIIYLRDLSFHQKYIRKFYRKCILAKDTLGVEGIRLFGDYGESFIPTDDFSATVDSSDNTKCTISGDVTHAIRKNARLFYRGPNGVGVTRVKSVSYDSTNNVTTVIASGALGNTSDSINVSTCIASGQSGTSSDGDQVYVFKLSRVPKNGTVKVLIKNKDGSWSPYNNFDSVSIYNSTSIQDFINNTGSTDEEIRFNSYLNWIAIDISKIYSVFGYSDEDDFKQNAVIEIYYETDAIPLELTVASRYITSPSYVYFQGGLIDPGAGRRNVKFLEIMIGKVGEVLGGAGYYSNWKQVLKGEESYPYDSVSYQIKSVDFGEQIKLGNFGVACLPKLEVTNGKIMLRINYNEFIRDFDTNTYGWEGTLKIVNYEATDIDANGNTCICGQKILELPYFAVSEDE